jgi:hypothetical protein
MRTGDIKIHNGLKGQNERKKGKNPAGGMDVLRQGDR